MKKAISLLISISMFFTMFVYSNALMLGDVDNDGRITAQDARKTLRKAVKLEELDDNQMKAADVDNDGKITAQDARIILRAAVKLEEIKQPDADENKEYYFNGKKVNSDTIGIEKGIVSVEEDSKDELLMPSFNDLVNKLKSVDSNYTFSGITKITTEITKPKVEATSIKHFAVKEMLQSFLGDSIKAEKTEEYLPPIENRALNQFTFPIIEEDYVSALKEEDIESISMTKISGLDFGDSLPDTFSYVAKDGEAKFNTTHLKNREVGEVYKVVVKLKDETIAKDNYPQGITPIEKIVDNTYNAGLIASIEQSQEGLSDAEEFSQYFDMSMEFVSNAVVTYYFDAQDFTPVAAHYNVTAKAISKIETYFNALFAKTDSVTAYMAIDSNSVQDIFYFFDK